jgi:hypothetical protein
MDNQERRGICPLTNKECGDILCSLMVKEKSNGSFENICVLNLIDRQLKLINTRLEETDFFNA